MTSETSPHDDLAGLFALLDEWLSPSTSPGRRAAIRQSLLSLPLGRAFVALSEEDEAGGRVPEFRARVLARLPAGSPAMYRRVADVVAAAWADPVLRERLRRDPRGTCMAQGVVVPDTLRLIVVDAESAVLPGGSDLPIPLPAPEVGSLPLGEARRRLATTPFGWTAGVPWSPRGTLTPEIPRWSAPVPPGVPRRGPRRRLAWAGLLWAAAGAAFVAAFWWSPLAVTEVQSLSGAAVDQGTSMGSVVLLGVAVLLAIGGVAVWRRR